MNALLVCFSKRLFFFGVIYLLFLKNVFKRNALIKQFICWPGSEVSESGFGEVNQYRPGVN